jgi:hypothetical protein
VDQRKTGTPAGGPDQKKQYAWHRHPALIAAVPAVFTLIGGIVLGQADVLPNAINPASPPTTVLTTTTATATATSTVTETVTSPPTPDPTGPGTGSVPGTAAPGTLTITVELGPGGKIGPDEWRAGSIPGANARVFDDTGQQLNNGCYPTWILRRGQTEIQRTRGTRCAGNGSSMFSFLKPLDTPGVYHLTVSAVTDGGTKGVGTVDFKVT